MRSTGAKRSLGTRRKYTSEERSLIYQGAPVTVLAEIFHTKRQAVERRLSDCPVAGYGNQGQPFYQIGEAARYLVSLRLTSKMIEDALQKLDPRDFPAMSNKMFWDALASRRKYEEQVGDLWHTTEVESVLATAFNAIRMAVLLLPDTLVDSAGLKEKQRVIVVDTIDAAIEELRDVLVDNLQKPSRSDTGAASEEEEL